MQRTLAAIAAMRKKKNSNVLYTLPSYSEYTRALAFKRPISVSKETYISVKRDLYTRALAFKNVLCTLPVSAVLCVYSVKRDLLQCTVGKAMAQPM
jgi:hypothetical protein